MSLLKMARKTVQTARFLGDAVRSAFRGKIAGLSPAEAVMRADVDGLADEALRDIEYLQHFGFASCPPAGSDAVVLPLGGASSHGVVVATQHGSFRIRTLKSGETAVFSEDGAKIVLKRGRIIEADCDVFRVNCKTYAVNASEAADFVTPKLETSAVLTAGGQFNGNGGMAVSGGGGARFTGNFDLVGDFSSTGALVNNGKDVGSGHTHTGDSGGTTSPPK